METMYVNSAEEELKVRINKLRDSLNEICTEIDEPTNIKRLIISRELDKLIVEYMSLNKQ